MERSQGRAGRRSESLTRQIRHCLIIGLQHCAISAIVLLPTILLLALLGGCMEVRTYTTEAVIAAPATLPRAHPGYVQWLRKQSLLEAAAANIALVSGTPLQWGLPEQQDRTTTLLRAAATWLQTSPDMSSEGNGIFTTMNSSLRSLQGAGIEGLFFSAVGESGSAWHDQPTDGRDTVSLTPSKVYGSDKEWATLTTAAERLGLRTGGDILPLATGVGPDFFLTARHVHDYRGLYMMLSIPPALWKELPPAQDFLKLSPLTSAQLTSLRHAGLLPPQDIATPAANLARDTGWAVTGPVSGVDGMERRWLYRWQGDILRPVLHWADPSGRAATLFSAALIQHTGVLRQTLASFDATPLFATTTLQPATFARSDAAAFCSAVSRENRKYGGWTLLTTHISPALLPAVLDMGVDFIRDSALTPAVVLAVLTGDSAPLCKALTEAAVSKLDQSRLARIMPDHNGILLPPAARIHLLPSLKGLLLDGYFHAGSLATAAIAAGCTSDTAIGPTQLQEITRRHALLLSFCAGLPGLFIPHMEDLRGTLLPLQQVEKSTLINSDHIGGTSEQQTSTAITIPDTNGIAPVSKFSLISDAASSQWTDLYPPLVQQLRDPDSIASLLGSLSRIRRQYTISEGQITATLAAPQGCAALVLTLPDGQRMLNVANFSHKTHALSLPSGSESATIVYGPARALQAGSLRLEAGQCAYILLR